MLLKNELNMGEIDSCFFVPFLFFIITLFHNLIYCNRVYERRK